MPSAPVRVDVWSDIACPFCYIGKRHFEAAVAAADVAVEVRYRSYQLSPDHPEHVTGTHAEMLATKTGVDLDQAHEMERRTTEAAAAAGLTFDYERVRPANTRHAHRLLHLALARDRQHELKERLLRAYFTDGLDIGDLDVLAGLAADAGLDHDEARRVLTYGSYTDAVDRDIAQAAAYGIRGVPFFVLDEKLAVSGAQPVELFVDALRRAVADQADTA